MPARRPFFLLLCSILLLLLQPLGAPRALAAEPPPQTAPAGPPAKIDPGLSAALAGGRAASFFVWLKPQADIGAARALSGKAERGALVLRSLQSTAAHSQQGVIAQLEQNRANYRSYYITNTVLVRDGSAALAQALAARPDVSRLTLDRLVPLDDGPLPLSAPGAEKNQASVDFSGVAPNLAFLNMSPLWSSGIDGAGVTVMVLDTGLMWDHPAIKPQYRGWNGASADHNYAWWDAAGDETGARRAAPYDLTGHGTHVAGTIAGSTGDGTVTGMAPGARLVACRAGDGPFSTSALLECLQWALAPWDLTGANPDPSKAPDILNNSWGSPGLTSEELDLALESLLAAGVVVVQSAGNNGPSCLTTGAESNAPGVISVAALDYAGLAYPGRLADFSSRGPSTRGAAYAPMIAAPGSAVMSAYIDGSYISWEGTSMAAPHVSGLAALLLDANPALKERPDDVASLIRQSAAPLAGQHGSDCGGDYTTGPNNDWGRGAIQPASAVAAALGYNLARGMLRGTITFAGLEPGAALPTATVQLTSGDLVYTALSDSAGQYALLAQVGHEYELALYAAGYGEVTGAFTPNAGAPQYRADTLAPIASTRALTGSVTDRLPGWAMPSFVTVMASTPAFGTFDWALASPADGTYALELPAGVPYLAQASRFPMEDHYQPSPKTSVPPGTGGQALDLTIEPDALWCTAQEFDRKGAGYDFYYPDYLPAGWQTVDLAGSGVTWNLGPDDVTYSDLPNVAGGLGNYARIDSAALPADAALVDAPIDLTNLMYAGVQFRYTLTGGSAVVDYSTDGGATWALLQTLSPGTAVDWWALMGARTAGKGSLRFRIRYQGQNAGFLAVDDFYKTTCRAMAGAWMYGTVRDANTSHRLPGARVTVTSTKTTTAESYPVGPFGGMYRLFVPLSSAHWVYPGVSGAPYFDRLAGQAYLAPGETTQTDFSLKAPRLEVQPAAPLVVTLKPGEARAVTLSVTNTGQSAGVARPVTSAGALVALKPADSWTWQADYPLALADASLTYVNGAYYAFGGQNSATVYAKGFKLSGGTPGWQPLPDLPRPRASHTAVALGGKIYLLGGWDNAHTLLTAVDVFDTATGLWQSAAPLPEGYLGMGAAAYEGKLLVIGGVKMLPNGLGGYYFSPVRVFFRYDPLVDAWETPGYSFRFAGFWGCLTSSNVLYCAGGYESSYPDYAGSLSATLATMNLTTQSVMNGANLLARHGQAASAAALGRLYRTGGEYAPAVGILQESTTGEFYEPEIDRWVLIPGIGDVRGAAGACGLMAVGGQSSSGAYYNRTWRLAGEGQCGPVPAPWLRVDQKALALQPGGSGQLQLTLDAAGLAEGLYLGSLDVFTGTPYGTTEIFVRLEVTRDGARKLYLPGLRK